MIGRTLGSYRVVEQIGMGGMATVYKAYDPNTDRYVALKVLPEHYSRDSEFYERFRREAKAIAKLEHIHILPVHAYGEEDGIAYLVMRYLPTGTLSERIRKGPMPLDEVSRLIKQIASALDYAHQQGILHRDVKPSNVLLDKDGNAYLTDFGIARIVESTVDLTGTGILGTPQYMSPEQCLGRKDLAPASDQYSLGVVLYEMVTGRTPFQAETPLAVIHMQLNDPLPPPLTLRPDLPEDAEKVILKALAKQPEARHSNCTAMAAAFEHAISHAPTRPRIAEPKAALAGDRTKVDQPLPDVPTTNLPVMPTSTQPTPLTQAPGSRGVPVWVFALVVILLIAGAVGLIGSGVLKINGPTATPPATLVSAAETPVPPTVSGQALAPTSSEIPNISPTPVILPSLTNTIAVSATPVIVPTETGAAVTTQGATEIAAAPGAPVELSAGSAVNGSLTGGQLSAAYRFQGQAGQIIAIAMTSTEVDSYLHLTKAADPTTTIANDNDAGGGTDALIGPITLPANGDYIVTAGSVQGTQTGNYTLTLIEPSPALTYSSGPVQGTLTDSARVALYTFEGQAGDIIAINMNSADFDAYLHLAAVADLTTTIANDNDGGGGSNALIGPIVLPSSGVYVIVAESSNLPQTGNFTLSLITPTPLSYGQDAVNGALTDAARVALYTFEGQAGDIVAINMNSADFDAYLHLAAVADLTTTVANDNDGGGGSNALIGPIVLPSSGVYVIVAESSNLPQTGSFTLSLITPTPLSYGQGAVNGALTDATHLALYSFQGQAHDIVSLSMNSPDLDSYLRVIQTDDMTSTIVADNDTGENNNALIWPFTLPVSSEYVIIAESATISQIGNFTLDLMGPPDIGQLSYGQGAVTGALTDAAHYALYSFQGQQGDIVSVGMNSADVDSNLWLASVDDLSNLVKADDDSGGGTDALIFPFTLPSTGEYLIVARTAGLNQAGSFTLDLLGPPDIGQLSYGQGPVSGALTDAAHYALYSFQGQQGDTVSLIMNAANMDSLLWLASAADLSSLVKSDDDSGANGNALIWPFTLPASGQYVILARSASLQQTGNFTLDLLGPPDIQPLVNGQPANGTLTSVIDEGMFSFDGQAGEVVSIGMNSDTIDSYLMLLSDKDLTTPVAADDDSGGGGNALISNFTLPDSGSYLVIAHAASMSDTGAFLIGYQTNGGTPEATAAAQSPQLLLTLTSHTASVNSVAYSPDGTIVASADDSGHVDLWNASTGESLGLLDGGQSGVEALAFSPDGKLLAAGGVPDTHLWNLSDQSAGPILSGGVVRALAFSPDGKTLAFGGDDLAITLWDVTGGTQIASLTGHTAAISDLAYSPDGALLASAGGYGDGTVRLWNAASHQAAGVLQTGATQALSLSFSPDGKTLAVGTELGVQLWDVASQHLATTLNLPPYGVVFSPNGLILATGSDDGPIHLWNLQSSSELPPLQAHTGSVWALAFSPDGTRLASGSADHTVRLWDVSAYASAGAAYAAQGDQQRANGNLDPAMTAYNHALDADPNNVQALVGRGMVYFLNGDHSHALDDFNQAIAIDPNSAAAYEGLGRYHDSEGEYQEAVDSYTQAIALNPNLDHSFVYVLRARAYEAIENYDAERQDLATVIAIPPQSGRADQNTYVQAYMARGDLSVSVGNYPDAVDDYSAAINVDATYTQAYISRGYAYAALGNNGAAVADYNQAITLAPDSKEAYYGRGSVYISQNNLDGAISDFTQAIALDSQYADAYVSRGSAYAYEHKYPAAIADFTHALTLNSNDAAAYMGRAEAAAAQGDNAQAITDFTSAISVNPTADAYVERGDAYGAAGDVDSAIADYTSAIQLEPSVWAYINRGDAYQKKNDYPNALADYTSAISLDGTNADAYLARAWAYNDQKQYDAAITDFTQVILLNPQEAEAYEGRGWAYHASGNDDQALPDFTQAITLDPNDVGAYQGRGWVYDAQGKNEQAIAEFSRAIELDANNADAYFGRGMEEAALGNNDAAIADFSKVIQLNTEDVIDAYFNRGIVYQTRGDNQRALDDFNQAITLDPTNSDFYFRRAYAYQGLGDEASAAADFYQYMTLIQTSVIQDSALAAGGSKSVVMHYGVIHRIPFAGKAGQTVTINARMVQQDGTLDALLVLLGPDGTPLVADDDSGNNLDSMITFTLPSDGTYTIVVSHAHGGAEGTLSVQLQVSG